MLQSNNKIIIIQINHHSKSESLAICNSEENGSCFYNFCLSISYSCQVEGHGGTLSKFSLKILKNFSRQIWKIPCFLILVYSPLSCGIRISDRHPSVKTLAFLAHCVLASIALAGEHIFQVLGQYLWVLPQYLRVLSRWIHPWYTKKCSIFK